jgi:hypothetical protein
MRGEHCTAWHVERLSDVFEVQLGKMLSAKARVGKSPKPYLRNKNVQWGTIDTNEIIEMDFNAREMEKFRLRSGDLLMCEGGVPGRTAIWRDEIAECYYQKAIHRLRPLNRPAAVVRVAVTAIRVKIRTRPGCKRQVFVGRVGQLGLTRGRRGVERRQRLAVVARAVEVSGLAKRNELIPPIGAGTVQLLGQK